MDNLERNHVTRKLILNETKNVFSIKNVCLVNICFSLTRHEIIRITTIFVILFTQVIPKSYFSMLCFLFVLEYQCSKGLSILINRNLIRLIIFRNFMILVLFNKKQ